MDCRNYRGISLLDTSYKILSNILLTRLKPYGEEIVGEYQAGFRAGRSTVDQIHTIKQIMEKSYEFNQDLFMLFIDYKQAHDSMVREELCIAIEDLGVPIKLIKLIRSCLQNSKCTIKANDYISKEFEVKTGLRQGDALSPMFFNIVLESEDCMTWT